MPEVRDGAGSAAGSEGRCGTGCGAEPEVRSFRIGPIRPPSEAASLLLQVTRGCTWNKCKFCNLYRHTGFKAYSADSVKRDIDAIVSCAERVRAFSCGGGWDLDGLNEYLESIETEEVRASFYMVAKWLLSGGQNVFLQDGNTTALSSGRLADVLIYLKQAFPQIRRITSYGRAEELSRHDADYFAELKEAGLDRIHSGFETGSDRVLRMINKGTTSAHEITAGRNIRAGGIELSVYFMPGIGGKELSADNAEGTAQVLNEVQPDFLRIRTGAVKPGTELYRDYCDGLFSLCSDDDKIREIRRVIELTEGIATRLVSDHMVNLIQELQGNLGSAKDRKKMLALIDRYLSMPETERRVYQLLRRSLQAYDMDGMMDVPADRMRQLREAVAAASEAAWDERMNHYISRYI